MHPPGPVTFRHLLMDDSASGSHPLHVTRGNGPVVPHAVAVFHGSGEHIGDGLDAAVGMPWETCQIIFRYVIAEVIQQKKWIEVGGVAETEGAS